MECELSSKVISHHAIDFRAVSKDGITATAVGFYWEREREREWKEEGGSERERGTVDNTADLLNILQQRQLPIANISGASEPHNRPHPSKTP